MERAPGGELKLTPREWACWTGLRQTLGFAAMLRAYSLPDEPVTRFEYLERMAFARAETRGEAVAQCEYEPCGRDVAPMDVWAVVDDGVYHYFCSPEHAELAKTAAQAPAEPEKPAQKAPRSRGKAKSAP